ncbi:MAG TPA: hypothetical protein VLZ81_11890 [Blastocatellia bacterium]|nr:hypothetical protein [Blastocatellia bacterium]
MPPLLPAGAARSLGKDHDVFEDGAGELQFEPQSPVNVAEAQGLNRVGAKNHRR